MTISSASRDRCMAQIDAAASVSSAKSRSDTASSEFAAGLAKPSALAVASRSMGKGVPASAAAPSGNSFSRLAASAKRPRSLAEHLDISQQMMAEGDRLRGLQMGEARHHRVAACASALVGERQLKRAERAVDRADLVPHIEPEVGRHLVVARARGMQLAGDRADQLGEPALDIQMDVLERAREFECAGLDLGRDLVEAARDLFASALRDDAGRAEHGDMRLGGENIVAPQPLVEVDGGVYLLHDRGGTCGEAAAPHGIGHDVLVGRLCQQDLSVSGKT